MMVALYLNHTELTLREGGRGYCKEWFKGSVDLSIILSEGKGKEAPFAASPGDRFAESFLVRST